MTRDPGESRPLQPAAMSRQDVLTRADEAFLAEWDENACPECETGTVIEVGGQCRETGHVPVACSRGCGWSG